MLQPFQPTSNAERQRRFREANPGYYARIKARERAIEKDAQGQYLARLAAEAVPAEAAAPQAPAPTIADAPTAC